MGSAAAWQLAKRGARVLGLDSHAPPHTKGSTHGDTRVTRLAIGEGPHLTPLAMRSHEIWREIELETGTSLLTTNGGLVISSDAKTSKTHVDGFFQNTVAAAERFHIDYEILEAGDIRRRFPQFRVHNDEVGYFEPSAGFVRPEACVAAQLQLARSCGADIHLNERVLGYDEGNTDIVLATSGSTYRTERLIVCAGSWLPSLIGGRVAELFRVYRQVLLWYDVEGPLERWQPEHFPIFIWELKRAKQGIYGFPALDGPAGGIKVATEQFDGGTTPDTVERSVSEKEIASTYERYVAPNVLGVGPKCVKSAVCLYTVTPDFGFVIDWLPGSSRVLIASPCSGHGFKHSAAIGEALAGLATEGTSRQDLSGFRFSRFL